MTPAFTRSALNKGIQMNEVKRYGNTWCEVTERTVFKHDQQDGDYVKLSDYTSLQEQLTATTNSLTNAHEALKSAGIEADTVQAGVMELVSRMSQVAAENAELKSMLEPKEISDEIQDLFNDTVKLGSDSDGYHDWSWVDNPEEVIIAVMNAMPKPATPATDAYLNAVRAEGVEIYASKIPSGSVVGNMLKLTATEFAAQLRSGNAGKDGSHE